MLKSKAAASLSLLALAGFLTAGCGAGEKNNPAVKDADELPVSIPMLQVKRSEADG